MANKDVQESIAKLVAARPRQLLDIVDGQVAGQQNFTTTQTGLVLGLRFLVQDFRQQAELVMDSGTRGKGAEATALRGTASALSLLADAIEKTDPDGPPEVLPASNGPSVPAEWCGDTECARIHYFELPMPEGGNPLDRGPLRRQCFGHRVRDLSGLRDLVQSRAGVVPLQRQPDGSATSGPIPAPEVTAFEFADPAELEPPEFAAPPPPEGTQADIDTRHGDLAAYLSGESDTMPGLQAALKPGSVTTVADFKPVDPTPLHRVNTPELKDAAAAMFADPTPVVPAGDPVMPGARLSWTDLRQVPSVAPVPHLSHSQGSTLDECGTRYRLERLEPEVVQRPKWASVGGKALHAAAEWFEREAAKGAANGAAGPEYMTARIEIAGGVAAIWAQHFSTALAEQAIATPSVPPNNWKAGGRGQSEGWTWWQVEGEAMLRRYLDMRLGELATLPASRMMLEIEHSPAVELEGVLNVEGVPVKVVIDQVWRWGEDGDSLMIDDLKSGAYAPNGTYQLALYAWYLRRTRGYDVKIWGRYWDARKGTFSEPVDLLEMHPWDEVVMRTHAQNTKKQAGLFNPAPSWGLCGGCPVKHACPAALTRG